MQKQTGFTMVELLVVIVLIGILSTVGAPSFSRWRNNQQFETDTQQVISLLGDIRASALADEACDGAPASTWVASINSSGIEVLCIKEGEINENTLFTIPWESDAVVTLATATSPNAWVSLVSPEPLTIGIFAGGTQSIIGTEYSAQWGRVHLSSAKVNKEKTICFSRIANYPFFSPSGACDDE